MRLRPALLGLVSLVSLAALAPGCATVLPGQDQFAFHEVQRRYTQSVRWARFDDARGFVQPDAQLEFETRVSRLGEIRFTNYRVRNVDMDPLGSKATVRVTYYAYERTSPMPVALDEEQHWERVPASRSWLVRSHLSQRPLQPGEDFL